MTLLEKYQEYPRTCKLKKSEDLLFSLMDEMKGRKRLFSFSECDEDIQEEILDSLIAIVKKKLKKK